MLVYNVHGFRGGVDAVARVIRRFEPDVALLNETGPRGRLRSLGRALGMGVAGDPWSPMRRRVKNAVLVRPPWRITQHLLHRFGDVRRRLNPRGALLARVEGSDASLWVCSVHLGLHPLERLGNTRELLGLGPDGTLVVGGDLNELPDGRAVGALRERFEDAWRLGGAGAGETFPAPEPTARIDYLFVSRDVTVERALVPAILPDARRASDHLPLVVDLRLTPSG